jgi:hypothetical protein
MTLTKPTPAVAAPIKKTVAKPAAKPVVKAAAKPAAKAAVKPAAKRPVKAAAKKPAVKSLTKTATKPVAKPATKPAVKKPVTVAAKKAATAIKTAKPALKVTALEAPKAKKIKQVRDSFTMPEPEYAVISQVKKACLKAGFEMKKSDLLRIGVSLIKGLDVSTLKIILATLTPLKAGRPKK